MDLGNELVLVLYERKFSSQQQFSAVFSITQDEKMKVLTHSRR